VLYRRLGIGRAPLRRVYSPGTLATYATAVARGERPARPWKTPVSLAPTPS